MKIDSYNLLVVLKVYIVKYKFKVWMINLYNKFRVVDILWV